VSNKEKKRILRLEGAIQRPSLFSPIMDLIRRLWKRDPKTPQATGAKTMEKAGMVTLSKNSSYPRLVKKPIPGGGSQHYYVHSPVKEKVAYKTQIMSVPTTKMVKEWGVEPVKVNKKGVKRVKLKQHAEDWFKYDSPFSAKNAGGGASLTNSHFMAALEAINKGELRTKTQVNKYMNAKVKTAEVKSYWVQVKRFRSAKVKTAGMSFLKQDRPDKVKEVYRALKRDHPEYSAEKKARITLNKGKPKS